MKYLKARKLVKTAKTNKSFRAFRRSVPHQLDINELLQFQHDGSSVFLTNFVVNGLRMKSGNVTIIVRDNDSIDFIHSHRRMTRNVVTCQNKCVSDDKNDHIIQKFSGELCLFYQSIRNLLERKEGLIQLNLKLIVGCTGQSVIIASGDRALKVIQ